MLVSFRVATVQQNRLTGQAASQVAPFEWWLDIYRLRMQQRVHNAARR